MVKFILEKYRVHESMYQIVFITNKRVGSANQVWELTSQKLSSFHRI